MSQDIALLLVGALQLLTGILVALALSWIRDVGNQLRTMNGRLSKVEVIQTEHRVGCSERHQRIEDRHKEDKRTHEELWRTVRGSGRHENHGDS